MAKKQLTEIVTLAKMLDKAMKPTTVKCSIAVHYENDAYDGEEVMLCQFPHGYAENIEVGDDILKSLRELQDKRQVIWNAFIAKKNKFLLKYGMTEIDFWEEIVKYTSRDKKKPVDNSAE